MSNGHVFSGFFSQLSVVCLLAVFILISLVAMFTSGVANEMDWLGMTVTTLGADGAAARGIPGDAGVFVEEVDGIAARAGIRHGDVLLAINGNRVRDMTDFSQISSDTDLSRGGVQLDVIRQGARVPVFVFPGPTGQPGGQAAPGGVAQAPGWAGQGGVVPAPPTINRKWLGIEAEAFGAGDANELGVPAGITGVLVDAVARGSRAEQAGLMANDVIIAVNGQRIDSTPSLWSTLAGLNAGDRIEFGIYRNGQLTSLVLPTAAGSLVGGFPGRMGGLGLGPGGTLICPNCGTKVTHQRGVACYTVACPACGTWMTRAR